VKISLSEFSDELNANLVQSQEQKHSDDEGSSKVFNFKAFLENPDALMPKEHITSLMGTIVHGSENNSTYLGEKMSEDSQISQANIQREIRRELATQGDCVRVLRTRTRKIEYTF